VLLPLFLLPLLYRIRPSPLNMLEPAFLHVPSAAVVTTTAALWHKDHTSFEWRQLLLRLVLLVSLSIVRLRFLRTVERPTAYCSDGS